MTTPTPTIQDLAEALHTSLCHLDHNEQCSWLYEADRADKWSERTHQRYLEKAKKLHDVSGLHLADLGKVVENI